MKKRTVSETIFEKFLNLHQVDFESVEEAASPRPDYLIKSPTARIYIELKELSKDDNFEQGSARLSTRTVGNHIRSKISEGKKQISYGAGKGIASILVIYNDLDPWHMFGTEGHDFDAAINGDWTLWIKASTREIVSSGHGRNSSFRENHNSSFSALGHLRPIQGIMTLRLFPNPYAKIPLPEGLPNGFRIASKT